MKIRIPVLFAVLSIFLTACSNGNYDRGYQEGYAAGYSAGSADTRLEIEDDYARGYEDALSEVGSQAYPEGLSETDLETILGVIRDAEIYASENSENDTETAMDIVQSYLNNRPNYFGEWSTSQDFEEAAKTLYYFFEYFYGSHYE